MEISPKFFAEASGLATASLSFPRSTNADFAMERHPMKAPSACQADWTILRKTGVNALLVGARELTDSAVARIAECFRQPLVWWVPEQTPDVPQLTTGTLIIRDVDQLDRLQQARLAQWIGIHTPCVQVVGLSREPLISRVAAGRFSPQLYYRLNVVMIEMRAATDLP